jgi:hypothetical protein
MSNQPANPQVQTPPAALAPAAERQQMLAKLQQAIVQQEQNACNGVLPTTALPTLALPPQPRSQRDWMPFAILGSAALLATTILGSVGMISARSPAAVSERQMAAMSALAMEASKQRSVCIAFVCPPSEPTAPPQQVVPQSFGNLPQQPQPAPTAWSWLQQESNESIVLRVRSIQQNGAICAENPGFCEALQAEAQNRQLQI